jgi:hypothetical protein
MARGVCVTGRIFALCRAGRLFGEGGRVFAESLRRVVGQFRAEKTGAVAHPTPRRRDFWFRPVTVGRHGRKKVTSRVTAPMKSNSGADNDGAECRAFRPLRVWAMSRNTPQLLA